MWCVCVETEGFVGESRLRSILFERVTVEARIFPLTVSVPVTESVNVPLPLVRVPERPETDDSLKMTNQQTGKYGNV